MRMSVRRGNTDTGGTVTVLVLGHSGLGPGMMIVGMLVGRTGVFVQTLPQWIKGQGLMPLVTVWV